MDSLYNITMGLIKIYSYIDLLLIRLLIKPIRWLTHKKFTESGVSINGDKPYDIKVHNPKFYERIANEQTLGLGESYMDGWWDCEELDEFFNRMMAGGAYKFWMKFPEIRFINYLQFNLFNLQTAKRSWEVAEKHYDLGNKLYESFLDDTMTYSCGYWKNAKNLNEAQRHKLELIGKKLKLRPGMKVLDIGCGWGSLCKYLAETYEVKVVGITVSTEGARVAEEQCVNLPVEIRVQDYRDVDEHFDRIVSVGMFEHVGRKNYRQFFKIAHQCLDKDGIFLCHTIGVDSDDVAPIEPWINKYIFPNGILPDHRNIPDSIHNLFTIEDWHNFGSDYDKTLMAWYNNFAKNWSNIREMFDEPDRFFRMWKFYLLASAGAFRSRKYHVWQIVLSKGGITGGYESVR